MSPRMEFAILTAMCWALSGFGSSRVAKGLGAALGNGLRLLGSATLLTMVCLLRDSLLLSPCLLWFCLAGLAHLAIADLCLFKAYQRLGPRIAVLLASSLAPLFALVVEFAALGTRVAPFRILLAVGILVSVACAIAPRERQHLSLCELRNGLLLALGSAAGFGLGSAVNRVGFDAALSQGVQVSPVLAALVRVLSGAVGVWMFLAVQRARGHALYQPTSFHNPPRVGGPLWLWMLITVFFGPFLGMIFFMQALEVESSALVQACVATLPVWMILPSRLFDGDVPSRRSLLAGGVAVLLMVWLARTG